MKKEHKDLLIADLCGRLPHGVKCNVGDNKPYTLKRIEIDSLNGHLLDFIETKDGLNIQVYLSEVKPYLFPLSSMTEEQKKEYQYITERWMYDSSYSISDSTDWLNKNNFDYRGLIPMGLAEDASKLNIY